jgi:hypothetical protein
MRNGSISDNCTQRGDEPNVNGGGMADEREVTS